VTLITCLELEYYRQFVYLVAHFIEHLNQFLSLLVVCPFRVPLEINQSLVKQRAYLPNLALNSSGVIAISPENQCRRSTEIRKKKAKKRPDRGPVVEQRSQARVQRLAPDRELASDGLKP
jgi:hypothetical protein